MSTIKHLEINEPIPLEGGASLQNWQIAYHTYGEYVPGKSKVVWVCHALTANSDVFDWWEGLFGEKDLFNPAEYFIVCANMLGSCYGSTGPASPLKNRRPMLQHFPLITTRDMAHAHEILAGKLGLTHIDLLIGASLGGQQALEWSIEHPERFKKLILIATNARHSAFGIAFNESQRLAIYEDPSYIRDGVHGGKQGLKVARSIAMLSYRSYEGYRASQRDHDERLENFSAAGYQRYQGEKLVRRFCAYTYVSLSKAMDAHHVGRGRTSIDHALGQIQAETLVIGIQSDILFPVQEQQFLVRHIPKADLVVIDSIYGHDGFLVESIQLSRIIKNFLSNHYEHFKQTRFKPIKQVTA